MATIKFFADIDLNQSQLKNPVLDSRASAPSSPSPVEGQLYYNSASNKPYYYDGSAWVPMSGDVSSADLDNYVFKSPATTSRNLVVAQSASVVPLTLRGASSQSANYFAVENGSGSTILSVDSGGDLNLLSGNLVYGGSVTTTLRHSASITSKTIDLPNVTGTVLVSADSSVSAGEFGVANSSTVGDITFRPIQASDIEGLLSLDDLSDVVISSPSDGQVLMYSGSNSQWENQTLLIADGSASYVTISAEAGLTNERVLTAGNGLDLVDGGANSTVTLTVDETELDHGLLGGLSDDDHGQYIFKTPTNSSRNQITPSGGGIDALTIVMLSGGSDYALNIIDNLTNPLFSVDAGGRVIVYAEDLEVLAGNVAVSSGNVEIGSGSVVFGSSVTTTLSHSAASTGKVVTLPNKTGVALVTADGSVTANEFAVAASTTLGDVTFITAAAASALLDHGSLSGLGDDDHSQYVYKSPADSSRNVITPTVKNTTGLTVKGSASLDANTDLFLVEQNGGSDLFRVHYVSSSTSFRTDVHTVLRVNSNNASTATAFGEITMDAFSGRSTGSINTSATSTADGGSILTNGFGSNSGGAINTSAGSSGAGGSINTSGGDSAAGGSIDLSNGGGSITLNGASGSIGFGVAATRTTLQGSGSAVTVTLPAITGTLMSLAGSQTVTGEKSFNSNTLQLAGSAGNVRLNAPAVTTGTTTYEFSEKAGSTVYAAPADNTTTTTTHFLAGTATSGVGTWRALTSSDLPSDTLDNAVIKAPGTDSRNNVQPSAGNAAALRLIGHASQSVNIFEIENSSNTNLLTVDNSGNVVIAGDLTVQGTTVTVNTSVVVIEDNFIVVNSTAGAATASSAGLEVERGASPNAFVKFDESTDLWYVDNGTSGDFQVARKYADTITGDGATTTFVVTHNLNTRDIVVQVWDADENLVDIAANNTSSADEVDISFTKAPDNLAEYRVVVIG